MWRCKKCKSELIAVYKVESPNFWGKVDKNFNFVEKDESEAENKEFNRVIIKFICDCDKEIESEEEFKEKAEWID